MKILKYIIVSFVLSLVFLGCGPKPLKEKIYTDGTITNFEIASLFPGKNIINGDNIYAPFNPKAQEGWHNFFEQIIFFIGITDKWRPEFDCNRFSGLKMSLAHVLFVVHSFHDWTDAKCVAVGEFWYIPDKTKKVKVALPDGNFIWMNEGHAINVAIEKNEGKIYKKFIDIYTGKTIDLSDEQIKSAYLIRF